MSQKRLFHPNGFNAFLKTVNQFCQKAQEFVYFLLCDFVPISPGCGPNTYQKYTERLKTSNIRVRNGNIKCPIGKSNFALNFPLKLFHATVANSDTESLKYFQTLFD